jgi:hypothetical protein
MELKVRLNKSKIVSLNNLQVLIFMLEKITMNQPAQYLTVDTAATAFNKSVATIRKLIRTRKIKYKKDKNRVLIGIGELTRLYGQPNREVQAVTLVASKEHKKLQHKSKSLPTTPNEPQNNDIEEKTELSFNENTSFEDDRRSLASSLTLGDLQQIVEMYSGILNDKDKSGDFLREQIKFKDQEISKLHHLIENQQLINLHYGDSMVKNPKQKKKGFFSWIFG